MQKLPTRYRWVGWFLIVLGGYELQWCVIFPPLTLPRNPGELLLLAGFVISPLTTLLAGILLLSSKPERHRLAIGVLLGGTIVSSVYACAVYSEMASTLKMDDPSAGIAIILVPVVILPAAVAAVTMLITAAMLLIRGTSREMVGEDASGPS